MIMDDTYKINLYDLLSKTDLSSIKNLKESLDNNGYYGRYKILEVRRDCMRTNKYKLKIYLVDSMVNYHWPREGYIKLNTKFENIKTALNDPIGVKHVLNQLSLIPGMTYTMYNSMYKVGEKSSKLFFNFVNQHNLIKNDGTLVLKSDIDIEEYLGNNVLPKIK